MNIFLYLDENTWFHRLDPRTKLIGAVILFLMALTPLTIPWGWGV
jgi:energy-coupling factor transporter transmembrane protein EcfT